MAHSRKINTDRLKNEIKSRLNDPSWSMSTAVSVYEKIKISRRKASIRFIGGGIAAAASIVMVFMFMTGFEKNDSKVLEEFVADQAAETYLEASGSYEIVQSEITMTDSIFSNTTDLLINEALASR